MAKIGSLVVDLVAETSSFNTNIKKASANLNSEAARMQKSLQSVQHGVSSLIAAGTAFAGGAIVSELKRVTMAGLEYSSALGEQSQQLGVTTEDLQVYRYAATQVGLSQEEMDKGLQKLTRTLGEAQLGSKKAAGTFSALGIDVRDAAGGLKTTSQIMPEVAEAISRISDPARRAAVEVKLFGRAGQQLDTLLAGGSAAIDDLRNAAQRLGWVLSNEQIQRADETADKLAELKGVLQVRVAGAVSDNVVAIIELANAYSELTSTALGALTAVSDFFRGVDKVKKDKGYLAFPTTPLDEFQGIGRLTRKRPMMGKIMDIAQNAASPKKLRGAIGGLDIDDMLAEAGGGRSRGGGSSRNDDAKRLTDEFRRQSAELTRQLQIDRMLAQGNRFGADLAQSQAQLDAETRAGREVEIAARVVAHG